MCIHTATNVWSTVCYWSTVCWSTPLSAHQQHLTNSVEAVQRCGTRRIYHDFNHHTSTTELVNKLPLQTLHEKRTVSKTTYMYKIMSGLVDITPTEGTLTANTPEDNPTSSSCLTPGRTHTCTYSTPQPSAYGTRFQTECPWATPHSFQNS